MEAGSVRLENKKAAQSAVRLSVETGLATHVHEFIIHKK